MAPCGRVSGRLRRVSDSRWSCHWGLRPGHWALRAVIVPKGRDIRANVTRSSGPQCDRRSRLCETRWCQFIFPRTRTSLFRRYPATVGGRACMKLRPCQGGLDPTGLVPVVNRIIVPRARGPLFFLPSRQREGKKGWGSRVGTKIIRSNGTSPLGAYGVSAGGIRGAAHPAAGLV